MNEPFLIEEPEETTEPILVEEPEPEPQAVAALPLVQVLPADFPLPTLIRFVPDVRLRQIADEAADKALAIEVSGRGNAGREEADGACSTLRAALKNIEEMFREPTELANSLHKSLTGTRATWLAKGKAAVDTVSKRIYAEGQRLEAIAAEERRKAQEEENRKLREEIARRAEEARKAEAPAAVVENLEQQAKVAQAAPVSTVTAFTPTKLAGSTTVKNWTCTIAGTPRADEQQPEMANLTPDQRKTILSAMQAVLDGKLPMVVFEINWPYLKKRAKADESSFSIQGFEAYDAGGQRAKGSRAK